MKFTPFHNMSKSFRQACISNTYAKTQCLAHTVTSLPDLELRQEGRREISLGVGDRVRASRPVGQRGSSTSDVRGVVDLRGEVGVGKGGGYGVTYESQPQCW